jgi:hypothetical protein
MPAGSTYTPIATTTLGSAATDITFSSIAGTYTDLVVIVSAQQVTLGEDLALQFNSDTGTNYSRTYLCGDGSTAHSGRSTSVNQIILDHHATPPTGTSFSTAVINIMNYSNTTTFKTVLDRTGANDTNPGLGTVANVGLWRSTSAITSVKVFCTNSSNLKTGTIATLYGIASA